MTTTTTDRPYWKAPRDAHIRATVLGVEHVAVTHSWRREKEDAGWMADQGEWVPDTRVLHLTKTTALKVLRMTPGLRAVLVSDFDGMTDGTRYVNEARPVESVIAWLADRRRVSISFDTRTGVLSIGDCCADYDVTRTPSVLPIEIEIVGLY